MKKSIYTAIILLLSFTIYLSINAGVENTARAQNNFNLDSVEHCVKQELKGTKGSSEDFTKALNSCAKGQRSIGITGDMFVIRQDDKKLFWDSSVDCKPSSESKLYMTEGGVCSLFSSPDTCIKATNYMVSNEPRGNLSWMFDDSKELIDYRYITIDGKKYIIGQGAQTDEAHSKFTITYVVLGVTTILMIVMSIL